MPTILKDSMRSVEEHQRVVAEFITARTAITAELPDAAGQVLSSDLVAAVSLPVFDNSAMDGYAVHASDVAAATADQLLWRRDQIRSVTTETPTSPGPSKGVA
jgi:molybdopterin biosynthesis enzyme